MSNHYTRADKIRTMSDEALAKLLLSISEDGVTGRFDICRELEVCDEDAEEGSPIPFDRCCGCVLHWLQGPAEESSI